MHLQVARSALKSLSTFLSSPKTALSPSSAYLSSLHPLPSLPLAVSAPSSFLSPALQLQLISLRASFGVARLAKFVQSGKKWSELSHECVEVSKGVTEAFLVRRMLEAVEGDEGLLSKGAGKKEKEVLKTLVSFVRHEGCLLSLSMFPRLTLLSQLDDSFTLQYILHTLETALPFLLEYGIIAPSPPSLDPSSPASVDAIEALREQLNSLAKQLLPEMVGLVDAFGFSDWELDSAVSGRGGRKRGGRRSPS